MKQHLESPWTTIPLSTAWSEKLVILEDMTWEGPTDSKECGMITILRTVPVYPAIISTTFQVWSTLQKRCLSESPCFHFPEYPTSAEGYHDSHWQILQQWGNRTKSSFLKTLNGMPSCGKYKNRLPIEHLKHQDILTIRINQTKAKGYHKRMFW